MSEEKSSKTNGLGADPMQRLASFKTPRDLTLGGIKPGKKVFTPNLNVARNKSKGPTGKSSNNQKRDEKDKKQRKNDRNKNFKNGPNIIKSSGVFSEGLGSAERHSSRMSYGRESDTVQAIRKPTIRVKDFVKIDKELEDQKIRSVLGESGAQDEESSDSGEDLKRVTERDAPIKLPMDVLGLSKIKPTVKVKQEIIVKLEPDDQNNVDEVEVKPIPDVKDAVFEDTDVVDLLRTDQSTLILLQFPDSLPGRGGRLEDEPPRRRVIQDEPTSSGSNTNAPDTKEEVKPVDNRCRLADLEEGRIGKLLIHRSGKVSLALGDTMFEVCSGTAPASQQEAVCVATDDASRSARLVSLGPLRHKLSLVPSWETLLADMAV